MEELTNQIIVVSARNDPEHARRYELLVSKLRQGFLQAPKPEIPSDSRSLGICRYARNRARWLQLV